MRVIGIDENLRKRIEDIYETTVNTVKVGETQVGRFFTTKDVRQGCPLSPLLFAIYIADIEDRLLREQRGGIVVGRRKFVTLAYADDLAIVSKTEEDLNALLKRLNQYLEGKKLTLNTKKTKVMCFGKGGGREKKWIWKWGEETLETVKEFKYLGYHFTKTNSISLHKREIVKKGVIAAKELWSIGERKIGGDFLTRMMLFDSVVRSILTYGAEIWGWEEQEEIEKLQIKFTKWTLGVDRNTPHYIILEETKRDKLRKETGRRAMRYEEKLRDTQYKIILSECWRDREQRETQGKPRSNWEKKRRRFYERNGYSSEEVENKRRQLQSVVDLITIKEAEIQAQERYNKIHESRYNKKYESIRTLGMPRYLRERKKQEHIKTIARFRCGNEENANKFWRPAEERRCRICEQEEETIEHIVEACSRPNGNPRRSEVLEDTGGGLQWMLETKRRRC